MEKIKIPFSIKVIAIFLITYSFLTLLPTLIALFIGVKKYQSSILPRLIVSIILIAGGFGLLRLKKWSLWLVNVLLGASFFSLFWKMIQDPSARTMGWIVTYIFAGCLIFAMIVLILKKKQLFR
ncbi:MAG: hypothetical protein ABSC11_14425 [Smithella sp.]|jgi:hypothetical protein